jgi:hypothetical protein
MCERVFPSTFMYGTAMIIGTFTSVSLVESAFSFLPLVLPCPQYCPLTYGARSEIISDVVSVCFPVPNRWGPPSRSHFPTLQVEPSEQEPLSQFSIRNQPNPDAVTGAWIPARLTPYSRWRVHPAPVPAPLCSSPPRFPPCDAPPAAAARLMHQPAHSNVSPPLTSRRWPHPLSTPLTSRRWQSALPAATPLGLPLAAPDIPATVALHGDIGGDDSGDEMVRTAAVGGGMTEAEGLHDGGEVEGDDRRQETAAAAAGAVAGVPGVGAAGCSQSWCSG